MHAPGSHANGAQQVIAIENLPQSGRLSSIYALSAPPSPKHLDTLNVVFYKRSREKTPIINHKYTKASPTLFHAPQYSLSAPNPPQAAPRTSTGSGITMPSPSPTSVSVLDGLNAMRERLRRWRRIFGRASCTRSGNTHRERRGH